MLKPVFVDTSAFIAMGNRRDFFHVTAIKAKEKLTQENRNLITTEAIFLEFGNGQPYFRIFNPCPQQQKFDCAEGYIYRRLPELKGISLKALHRWHKKHVPCDYPVPLVSHEVQRTKAFSKQTQLTYQLPRYLKQR